MRSMNACWVKISPGEITPVATLDRVRLLPRSRRDFVAVFCDLICPGVRGRFVLLAGCALVAVVTA